jgi:multidrug efflux pump subunit AcrA (membrane-fusion protein)
MNIQELMAHYEDIRFRAELAQADYQTARDAILTPEQRQQLADLEARHEEEMEEIQETLKAAEARVKQAVAALGESVKGERWHAVWSKPRTSWDTKGLVDWFKGHDLDILDQFKREGEPSVSIRLIKQD